MSVRPSQIRRLSDEQLLNAQFRYTDPERSIPELNPNIPDPEAHPTIIGYYDDTPAGGRKRNPDVPYIRCCHCGLRRHWIGHVVQDDRDQVYIIGASGCGREHYGVRYEAAERAFKEERARQAAIRRWGKALPLVSQYLAEIDVLLASPRLRDIEAKTEELRRASPEGFRALSRIAANAEAMVERRQVRDFEEEARRRQKYERDLATNKHLIPLERKRWRDDGRVPELDDRPVIRAVETPLGFLAGGDFLADGGDVRKRAIALRTSLTSMRELDGRGTDAATLTELTRHLRDLTYLSKELRETLIRADFTGTFFEEDNVERLERWSSSDHHRFSCARADGGLLVFDPRVGRTLIASLPEGELPHCPKIMEAEYLTEEFEPMLANAA